MQYVNEVYGVFTAYTSLSPDCPEYRSKDPVTQGQSSFRLLVIAPGWIDYFAWYPDDLSFVSNRLISSTTSPWYNVHEKWAWHVGFHWFHFPRSFLHVDCLCTIFVQCILVFSQVFPESVYYNVCQKLNHRQSKKVMWRTMLKVISNSDPKISSGILFPGSLSVALLNQ